MIRLYMQRKKEEGHYYWLADKTNEERTQKKEMGKEKKGKGRY